ncbi:DUF2752 domain-containing protein [bacterium]|nr:DUF2752 domain-containing protein [bacterium]
MHPIHGVWVLIALIAVITARLILPYVPNELMFCPSWKFFGIRCPACGSGTALMELSNFRLLAAILANPLFVLGGLALLVWGLMAFVGYSIGRPLKKWATTQQRKGFQRYFMIVLLALNWIYEVFIRG